MELVFIVYLVFTLLPALAILTSVAFWLWVVACFISMFIGGMRRDVYHTSDVWDWTIAKVIPKWKVALPFLILSALIPSKEVTACMIGAYGTQKLVERETAQTLASDGVDVLKTLLAKAKTELEAETK